MAGVEYPASRLFKLVQAAYNGNLEDAKRYVSRNNVNQSCTIYCRFATPLGGACRSGHTDIVWLLLEFGADVNVKSDQDDTTPLHLACEGGHLDIVRILLARGANIEDTDWHLRTALHRACDSGHHEVVATLLEHGADVNLADQQNWSPLHIARSGRVVRTLLENGADLNARDWQGFTPLARMSPCDDESRVSTLLDYGAGMGLICGLQHSELDPYCSKTVLMCCYDSACNDEMLQERLPCFERHFIKLSLAGVRIKEMEKLIDPSAMGKDWTQSERDTFAEQCLGEVQAMKTHTIGNSSATYYSLLTRNLSDLRGQQIVGQVNWEDCHRRFPLYGNMIRCSYRTLRRFFLKEQSLEFFFLVHKNLLSECAEMVLDYLPNEDLETIASMVSQRQTVDES